MAKISKMSFTASKQRVLDSLSIANVAVSTRPVCPYMACVLIEASDGVLNFSASNGAQTIRTGFSDRGDLRDENLEIQSEGQCLINASYFTDAVKKLAGDLVHVEIVDGWLTAIEGGDAKFRINGEDPADFPKINIPETTPVILNGGLSVVSDVFKRTAFAVSKKTAREILTGINLSAENGALVACATDSFRLSRLLVHSTDEGVRIMPEFPSITIPLQAITAMTNVLKGENVEMRTDGTVLSVFDDNGTALMSTLLSGSYPGVSRLIPTEFVAEAQFNRAELADAAERSLFIRTDSVSLITLDISANKAILSSHSAEIGAYRQELAMKNFSGEPLKLSLDGMYLAQALKALHGDDVTMRFKGLLKPIVAEGSDGADNIQLLLPVRTVEETVKF